ncbi:hypothetical protein DdX_01652 [Ditylenchus destructor]|uniref:Uncharacterized protein n=1 Tax=Ditylenchus destructor TaxID=166010 RepID=A0AAD4RDZ6_9BILA|nr:hypothetical protein DdX_01652 [Ditylenchus destructor]
MLKDCGCLKIADCGKNRPNPQRQNCRNSAIRNCVQLRGRSLSSAQMLRISNQKMSGSLINSVLSLKVFVCLIRKEKKGKEAAVGNNRADTYLLCALVLQ